MRRNGRPSAAPNILLVPWAAIESVRTGILIKVHFGPTSIDDTLAPPHSQVSSSFHDLVLLITGNECTPPLNLDRSSLVFNYPFT